MKKLISCLLVSAMLATAFASCGDSGSTDTTTSNSSSSSSNSDTNDNDTSDEKQEEADEESDEETEEETEAEEEEETEEETEAEEEEEEDEDVPVAVSDDLDFEDPVEAESGDAILAMVDGQWYVQYWGTIDDYLTYDAGVAHITGDGDYTVSVTADTNGFRYDITGDVNGDYTPAGISFAAIKVFDGTTLYPDMSIEITSIKVDGKELDLTAKNYTSSDDGVEMRANIYNSYVNALPDDAHNADGLVTDDTEYNWEIVNEADFADGWTTIEVDFTVTGTGAEKSEDEVSADEDADTDAEETEDSADENAESEETETEAE